MPPAPSSSNNQETRDLRGMRPNARPMIRAVAMNATLAILLLGVPWYRGRVRAEMTAHAYVAYVQCLHAGTTRPAPGLALPDGNRERFAALYVEAVPEWPASCRDELEQVPRDEALFLMPGAKAGEEEVRAAVIGARAALDEVTEARASERPRQIPRRLLRTVDHLAAAVSVNVSETGIDFATDHLAFDLGEGPSLVTPSRVPLQTASGGPMNVTVHGETVRIATADGRSAAVIAVHDGQVDITQVRRAGAARALIDDGEHTYLGWVTGDATCAHDEAHCAHRLTGLARVREGVSSPEPEVWIAAHPGLGLSRSFAFDGGLAVFARTVDGVELRRFALPEPWPDPLPPPTDEAPVTPITGTIEVLTPPVNDAVIAEHATIVASAGHVLACGSFAFVVDGDAVEVREVVEDVTAPIASRGTHPIDVLAPLRAIDPLEDHLRCAASEAGPALAWIDHEGTLRLVDDLDAWRVREVAAHVAGFAMARTGETTAFATWGEDGEREITLRRVWHGRVLASDVAADCWDDGSGLCGPAGLAQDGDHVFLFAREGTDLRVLRVTGAGLAALPGLD